MELEPPRPRQWRASDSEAVELCREWMIYLGAVDAVVTHGEARAVCDLYSANFLGWVDNRRQNLDVDVVKNKNEITTSASWTRTLPLVGNASLLLDFEATATR